MSRHQNVSTIYWPAGSSINAIKHKQIKHMFNQKSDHQTDSFTQRETGMIKSNISRQSPSSLLQSLPPVLKDSSDESDKSASSDTHSVCSEKLRMTVENNCIVYKLVDNTSTNNNISSDGETNATKNILSLENVITKSITVPQLQLTGNLKESSFKNSKFPFTGNIRKPYPILKVEKNLKESKVFSKFSNDLLIHGPSTIPRKFEEISEFHFTQEILTSLDRNLETINELQSYMWAGMLRGCNVCAISNKKTGPIMAFIPPLCHFVLEKSSRFADLSKYNGPLITVLSLSMKECKEIDMLIKQVIGKNREKVVVNVLSAETDSLDGSDIVISTPSLFLGALKLPAVNLKRLCLFVLNDAETVLRKCSNQLGEIFNLINAMVLEREHNKPVKVVISSEKWSLDIRNLLEALHATPFIYINNYLEAAIYGGVKFVKKKFKAEYRKFLVEDILRSTYLTMKAVIVCDDSEVDELNEYLRLKGMAVVCMTDDLKEDDFLENEHSWISATGDANRVLICTDSALEKSKKILDAVILIHYDIPDQWNWFVDRFRCFVNNIHSPLHNNEDKITCKTYVILQETTDEEIFFNIMNALGRNSISHFKL